MKTIHQILFMLNLRLIKSSIAEIIGSNIVIWTTTPWTIPGNRAVAYGKDLEYSLIEIKEVKNTSLAKLGDKIIIAKDLQNSVLSE